MEIKGPGAPKSVQSLGKVGKPRSTGGASGASFADSLGGAGEAAPASGTGATAGIGGIDQLLGLQQVDDALAQKRQTKARGGEILDRLDELRLQILDGRLSKDRLLQLAQLVSARRVGVADPQLLDVLDEIDLRAQVEIAKFTRDEAKKA